MPRYPIVACMISGNNCSGQCTVLYLLCVQEAKVVQSYYVRKRSFSYISKFNVRKIAIRNIVHAIQLVLPFRTNLADKCPELSFMHE
jgi:hypothetical protein